MWWVALAFTLGLMALFQVLTRAGPLEARATLALGFLIVAAHLGGELARRLRLPRITGFLVTGFVVGPAWLGLVRADEVLALGFISDAAMALIAFGAGSLLTLEMLRRDRLLLARLSLGTILVPLGVVTAVIVSVARWFPLTVHQPLGDALAVALVLGTIAAASSPAMTMALIDELDAREEPVARTMLAVSIVKDVLVIVLFALVLANLRLLTSPGAVDMGVAWTTLLRGVGSIAAGVALGYAASRYARILGHDTLLLVAMAFLTALGARLAGLETMLLALAAGFYVANFAAVEGERLQGEIKRGALPVYIAFFALAGAALQAESLQVLMENWPWMVLLVSLRALGLRVGTRFAGSSSLVPSNVARHAWLGFVSQAGVALGLGAAARRAFPEWGVSLQAWIVVMVGVHEIAGPLCFRRALRLTGEVTKGEYVTEKGDASGAALVPGSGSL